MTERTYDSMIRDARESLRSGHGVILDATFSKRAFRDRLRETLGDRNLKWVVAEVDGDTALQRLRLREGQVDVVSDARLEDRELLNAAFEEPDELPEFEKRSIQTNGSNDSVVHKLLRQWQTNVVKRWFPVRCEFSWLAQNLY